MKISACSVSFRNEPFDIFKICDIVAGIGIKYVELWGNHLYFDKNFEKFLKKLFDRLAQNNLSVSMIAPYFDLTADKTAFNESMSLYEKILFAASKLRCPLIRVFTGNISSNKIDKKGYGQCVGGLLDMSDKAAKKNIKLAIETHPDTLADNIDACLKLMKSVNRDNVGINLDVYHMWEEHNMTWEVFDILNAYVLNIHAKNIIKSKIKNSYQFLHRKQAKQKFSGIANLENGDMPYKDFLAHIKDRFDGAISIEWFGDNPVQNIKKDLDFIRLVLGKSVF